MEPRTDWERLVALYAGDREICNCRQAYYSHCAGKGECGCSRNSKGHTYCEYACSTNKIRAKEEIAGKVLLALTLSEIGKLAGKKEEQQDVEDWLETVISEI